MTQEIYISKLPSGFTFLGGSGVCNWAQVPSWPADEETIRASAFSQASEEFIQSCITLAETTRCTLAEEKRN